MKNKKIFFNPMSAIVIVFIIAAFTNTVEYLLSSETVTLLLVFDVLILIFGSLTIRELNKYQKSKHLGESTSGIFRHLSRKYALRYILLSCMIFSIKTIIIASGTILKLLF